jgi:methylated-DNA-protein-cysteine methyltransferase-like protein
VKNRSACGANGSKSATENLKRGLKERGNMNVDDKTYREKVYKIVREIPSGRVMTYGQIAEILGEGYTARTVGYVMHAAETENVPWQRVINSQGGCSTGKILLPYNVQQKILEDEGVTFNDKGKCDLEKYRWFPEGFEPEEDEQPSLFE